MKKIMKDGKTLLIAFDHGFEHGPANYKGINLNPKRIVHIAKKGGANGIILHAGTARYAKDFIGNLALIIKLTGKTSLVPEEDQIQAIVTTIEEAVRFNPDGIAATVYIGTKKEWMMLERFALIKNSCIKRKLPLIGFFYPRGSHKYDPDSISYAARIGSELGADIVKTYYTGDKVSFRRVVENSFVPIGIAGGQIKENEEDILNFVKDVMDAGACGLVIGRNIWMRSDEEAVELLKKIKEIIYG